MMCVCYLYCVFVGCFILFVCVVFFSFVFFFFFFCIFFFFFFFKQKTAYEIVMCWSSDVCSSDLPVDLGSAQAFGKPRKAREFLSDFLRFAVCEEPRSTGACWRETPACLKNSRE